MYFEFGWECMHEGVGVCSGLSGCYVYWCNHYIYLCILMCPCWQGFFSVLKIYFLLPFECVQYMCIYG